MLYVLSLCVRTPPAYALGDSQPVHTSGDKQLWDRKKNQIELFGHAVARQPGETLSADYILMNMNTRAIDARGHCVYISAGDIIYGEEMHFNLDTRTGVIIGGRVSNRQFTLSGDRINKLGEGRFQAHWGEYSTCHDCPSSWSLLSEDVDMQMEGYAYLSNVTTKIGDVPTLWFPYLVLPMKSRRQTGFLFPTFGVSSANGVAFVEPYFWAIDRSADMTFDAGVFSKRGFRGQGEGRYQLNGRNAAKIDVFYLSDHFGGQDQGQNPQLFTNLSDPTGRQAQLTNRWAVDVTQTQDLPWGLTEKLKFDAVSDNLYPYYVGDVGSTTEMVLPSILSLSYASPSLNAYVAFKRYRDLMYLNNDPYKQATLFDPNTVQVLPAIQVTTNDQYLFDSPFAYGLTVGLNRFTRSGGSFDFDPTTTAGHNGVPVGTEPDPSQIPVLGIDPLRKATRFSVTPSIYTTLRPFDVLNLTPSLTYYGYLYSFPSDANVPDLYRGYLNFQVDLSTQFEKYFEFPDDKDVTRSKHLIRPILTYSWIPSETGNTGHPFLLQINNPGYNFDDLDIIPIDNSPQSYQYFPPLGNSLAYGFTTQYIRRRSPLDYPYPLYQRTVEFSAGQSVNFLQFEQNSSHQPLTRFFSNLDLHFDRVQSLTTYYYYPYQGTIRHVLNTGLTFIWEKAIHQGVLAYEKSFTFGYGYNRLTCTADSLSPCGTSDVTGTINYSINDYILPSFSIGFDQLQHSPDYAGVSVAFQSPSRCWKFSTSVGYTRATGWGWGGPDLAVNITGSGFGGVSELATAAQSQTGH